MNPVLALQLAQAVLSAVPGLLSLGMDISGLISQTNTVLASGADPTPADWDTINATISAELAKLAPKVVLAPPAAVAVEPGVKDPLS